MTFTFSDEYVRLLYSCTRCNAHVPNPENQRYRNHPINLPRVGSQHFGALNPHARILKVEFHPGYVSVAATDATERKLRYETFEAHLGEVKAAASVEIIASTINHEMICRTPGWTNFLKDVSSFTLLGGVSLQLMKKLLSRLPATLDTFIFLPDELALEIDVAVALGRVPQTVQLIMYVSIFVC